MQEVAYREVENSPTRERSSIDSLSLLNKEGVRGIRSTKVRGGFVSSKQRGEVRDRHARTRIGPSIDRLSRRELSSHQGKGCSHEVYGLPKQIQKGN